jgi:hypothetical protein
MTNPIHDSWFPGRDLNPGPPEYEGGVLTTRPRRTSMVGCSVIMSLAYLVPACCCSWVGVISCTPIIGALVPDDLSLCIR